MSLDLKRSTISQTITSSNVYNVIVKSIFDYDRDIKLLIQTYTSIADHSQTTAKNIYVGNNRNKTSYSINAVSAIYKQVAF